MSTKPLLACDTETKGLHGDLLGVCFVGENLELPFSAADVKHPLVRDSIQNLLNTHRVVFHNAAYDIPVLRRAGFTVGAYHDTMILSYLINPLMPCDLDSVALEWLGKRKIHIENKSDLEWNPKTIEYCFVDTQLTYNLAHVLLSEIQKYPTHYQWYEDVEIKFVEVIIEMESIGFCVDRSKALTLKREFSEKLDRALEEVHSIVPFVKGEEVMYKKELEPGFGYYTRNGEIKFNHCSLEPFNPNSGQQVANVLIEKYGWVPERKTEKGAVSTESEVLSELFYPLIDPILTYKEYDKAIGTFLKAFIEKSTPLAGDYAILRGSFNQCVAITGRLSSSSPNLQNLPADGDIGLEIRSLVCAPPGYDIVGIDLSNIEARVLAHYLSKVCGFTDLADDFVAGVDFHQSNADLWGCTRSHAKTVLYGLLYGCGPAKLSAKLRITKEEAKRLMEQVYRTTPVTPLKEKVWANCRSRNGHLYTCMGRRLYYPHINAKNHVKRSQAERQTFNALLQGGAADILKRLTLDVLPDAHSFEAFLAASVHDELLLYCPEPNSVALAKVLNEKFRAPYLSHCPIEGTAKIGKTWRDVH